MKAATRGVRASARTDSRSMACEKLPPASPSTLPRICCCAGQESKKLESQMGLTKSAAVPSAADRTGDFSQSPRKPNDPTPGMPSPGGIIPADRISRNGKALIARFPLPDAGQRTIATLTPTQNRDIREDILRFDGALTAASSLSTRYLRDTVDQIEPYGSFGG